MDISVPAIPPDSSRNRVDFISGHPADVEMVSVLIQLSWIDILTSRTCVTSDHGSCLPSISVNMMLV